MPPKTPAASSGRWQKPSSAPTPDFNSAAAVVPIRGPKPATMSQAITQLKAYVRSAIEADNLLGLGADELNSTTDIIASCTDRAEVFNWAKTLMLPEAFAAEVVKRREDITRLGLRTDEDDTVSTASTTASRKGGKKGARAAGRTVQLGGSSGAANAPDNGGLIEGQTFECGCFATRHALKSNCLNCGRIICQQESDDECYACGLDPSRCVAYEIKAQTGALDAAVQDRDRAAFQRATEQRDRLLQYARERAKRTSVIDDQSGMYANVAWVSQAEREAAVAKEAENRKKVAALHQATGAYTVHLDIVNQSTALGATQLQAAAAAGQSKQAAEELDDEAVAASMKAFGLAADDAAPSNEGETANKAPAVPAALLQQAKEQQGDNDDDDDDPEDTALEADAGRAHALPSLMKRIFYQGDGGGAPTPEGDGEAATATKPVRRTREGGRMQTDYYEDDRVTWRIAREQRRLGAATAPGGGDEEEPAEERTAVRAPSVGAAVAAEQEKIAARAAFAKETAALRPAAAAAAEPDDGDGDGAATRDDLGGAAGSSDPSAALKLEWRRSFPRLRAKDQGMCLSMHQPWASLLVAGIKTHEGRQWPSDFRGRLWIHAAAAKPSHADQVEAQYVPFLKPGQTFPTSYPTSCLLGHVTVLDNLDHTQYTTVFSPDEQQEQSDYKFICDGATELPFALAMDGKHKIFKLERKLWLAARKQMNEGPPTK